MSWLLSGRSSRRFNSTKADNFAEDDGSLVVVPLMRVSSKEDVLRAVNDTKTITFATNKKRPSSKEGLPEDAAPSLKRVPSKEDIKNMRLPAKPMRKKSIPAPKLSGLELALTDKERLEKAIKVAEQTHCAEGLKFLREFQILESMDHGEDRRKLYAKLQSKYFKQKSPDELYLPADLRDRLIKKGSHIDADDLREVRRLVINEIRFNERVIETLMPSLYA